MTAEPLTETAFCAKCNRLWECSPPAVSDRTFVPSQGPLDRGCCPTCDDDLLFKEICARCGFEVWARLDDTYIDVDLLICGKCVQGAVS